MEPHSGEVGRQQIKSHIRKQGTTILARRSGNYMNFDLKKHISAFDIRKKHKAKRILFFFFTLKKKSHL